MTKGQLLTQAYGKGYSGIDVAYPCDWADAVRKLGIDPNDFCYDHRTSAFGKPLNIADPLLAVIEKAKKVIEEYKMGVEFEMAYEALDKAWEILNCTEEGE